MGTDLKSVPVPAYLMKRGLAVAAVHIEPASQTFPAIRENYRENPVIRPFNRTGTRVTASKFMNFY